MTVRIEKNKYRAKAAAECYGVEDKKQVDIKL
jgi:hypothetical protein